jgi:hypothetical protein
MRASWLPSLLSSQRGLSCATEPHTFGSSSPIDHCAKPPTVGWFLITYCTLAAQAGPSVYQTQVGMPPESVYGKFISPLLALSRVGVICGLAARNAATWS